MKIQTTNMLRTALYTAAIAAMLGLPAAAAQAPAAERLQAMARTAATAPEHAEVAKQYRLHAEALDAQAAKQEEQVTKLARSAGATADKWPAMANGHQEAKEKAVQARRAAAESRKLADHHARLVVEAQATPAN